MAKTNRRRFLNQIVKSTMGAAGFALASQGWQGCSIAPNNRKWNLVFILADDLGWNQVGYHGTKFYETPNVDRIAREGMRFTDAYAACPVCSPTRASIMTGKYPARLHLTDFIAGNSYPHERLLQPEWTKYLPLEEVTIAEALKETGYVTGHFGKWHLNKDKNYEPGRPLDPGSQGFDDVLATVKPDSAADPDRDAHHVREITENALRFLQENKDRPFFLYLPHHVVHMPLLEKEDLIAKYRAKPGSGLPENNPLMGAMIETLDRGIGAVMDKLDELNLSRSTILIFYSDNGGLKSQQDQTPLRGGKAMVYEGGIRVPLAVRWPGVVQPGSVSRTPVSSVDFFPTICEMAGIGGAAKDLDGESIVSLLTQSGALQRDAIFWHYPHYHSSGNAPSGAIRAGEYKLIEWYENSVLNLEHPVSLYKITDDIGEQHDLAEALPEKAAELRGRFHDWLKAVKAQSMKPNPNHDPSRATWSIKRREA